MISRPLPNANVLPQLVKRRAEVCCRLETPEAQHRVVALFDGGVVLLGEFVQILAAPVEDLSTQDPTRGTSDAHPTPRDT